MGSLIVGMVGVSIRGNLVVTLMLTYSATQFVQQQQQWIGVFESYGVKRVTKHEQWVKVIAHGIPTIATAEFGIEQFKEEIETFNKGIQIIRNPQ